MITAPFSTDGPDIHRITANAGVFSQEEIDCVDELWQETQSQGQEGSGYYWLIARDDQNRPLGYSCYGHRALTSATYDLYWIAVDSTIHRSGIGRQLLSATEQAVRELGGHLLFVETSGLPKYEPTRQFYLRTGYLWEATIKDFYAPGDDLVIFTKHL